MVLWYTHKADALLSGVLDRDLTAYEASGGWWTPCWSSAG